MEKWRMWAEAKTQNAKVPVHTEAPPQYLIIIIVEFLLKHKASLQVPLTQFQIVFPVLRVYFLVQVFYFTLSS